MPATIGILDGEIVVGLTEAELGRFDASARKIGPRDSAAARCRTRSARRRSAGRSPSARRLGIRFMAHRRARRRAPRLADAAGRLGRPRRARAARRRSSSRRA